METRKPNKGGRPALADPAKHRHVLYLNDRENARFLSQWGSKPTVFDKRTRLSIVYPGHGAPTTIGIEKAENPFFR